MLRGVLPIVALLVLGVLALVLAPHTDEDAGDRPATRQLQQPAEPGAMTLDASNEAFAPRALELPAPDPLASSPATSQDALPAGLPHGASTPEVTGSGLGVAGRVLTVGGSPVSGARIEAARRLGGGVTTSDEAGLFLLDDVQNTSDGWLLVSHDAYAVCVVQPVLPEPRPRPDLVAVLEPPQVLAGHIVFADGMPVADAPVRIEGSRVVDFPAVPFLRLTWESQHGLGSATTDANGAFRFDQLYAGTFDLTVTVETGTHAFEQNVSLLAGRDDLLVVVEPSRLGGFRLTGDVRDLPSGEPVTRFALTPFRARGPNLGVMGRARSFDNPDGSFLVSGLEPGTYDILITGEGYPPWQAPPTEYGQGEYRLDVVLAPGHDLVLRVVDEAGVPVPHAKVSFSSTTGERILVDVPGGEAVGARNSEFTADEHGELVARGLPEQRIVVKLVHPEAPVGISATHHLDVATLPEDVVVLVLPSTWRPGEDFVPVDVRTYFGDPSATIGWDPSIDDPLRAVEVEGLILRNEIHPFDREFMILVMSDKSAFNDTLTVTPLEDGRWSVTSMRKNRRLEQDDSVVHLQLPRGATRIRVRSNAHVGCSFEVPQDTRRAEYVALLGRSDP